MARPRLRRWLMVGRPPRRRVPHRAAAAAPPRLPRRQSLSPRACAFPETSAWNRRRRHPIRKKWSSRRSGCGRQRTRRRPRRPRPAWLCGSAGLAWHRLRERRPPCEGLPGACRAARQLHPLPPHPPPAPPSPSHRRRLPCATTGRPRARPRRQSRSCLAKPRASRRCGGFPPLSSRRSCARCTKRRTCRSQTTASRRRARCLSVWRRRFLRRAPARWRKSSRRRPRTFHSNCAVTGSTARTSVHEALIMPHCAARSSASSTWRRSMAEMWKCSTSKTTTTRAASK